MVADLKTAPAARFEPGACPRLVVKIGSALLVNEAGAVRREWLLGVVSDIAARRAAGVGFLQTEPIGQKDIPIAGGDPAAQKIGQGRGPSSRQ